MAGRLAKLNGWQRLWLVGTVCLGLWFMGLWPLMEMGEAKGGSWQRDYRNSVVKDLKNPNCREYQVRPFSELYEPLVRYDNGGDCWHIFASRKYDDSKSMPYTLEVYDRNEGIRQRYAYIQALVFGTVITLFISMLVYLVGKVIAWIIGGFRQRA